MSHLAPQTGSAQDVPSLGLTATSKGRYLTKEAASTPCLLEDVGKGLIERLVDLLEAVNRVEPTQNGVAARVLDMANRPSVVACRIGSGSSLAYCTPSLGMRSVTEKA